MVFISKSNYFIYGVALRCKKGNLIVSPVLGYAIHDGFGLCLFRRVSLPLVANIGLLGITNIIDLSTSKGHGLRDSLFKYLHMLRVVILSPGLERGLWRFRTDGFST